MAFDIKEFLLAVLAVIIGAYILNYLEILKHSSVARARTEASNMPRNGYNVGRGIPSSSYPTVNPVIVPRSAGAAVGTGGTRIMNNVGPTEPTRANMSKQIGSRTFVT